MNTGGSMAAKLKTVLIEILGNHDKYTFQGPWGGNDVYRVMRHIAEQYRYYKRDMRRGKVDEDGLEEDTLISESDLKQMEVSKDRRESERTAESTRERSDIEGGVREIKHPIEGNAVETERRDEEV